MPPATLIAGPSVTDWVSAVSNVAYTLLTLLLVIFAVYAWRTAKDALVESRKASLAAAEAADAQRTANQQAAEDSRNRSRPYVYTEIVPGLQGPGSFDLRIANAGRSLATEVKIDVKDQQAPDPLSSALMRLLAQMRTIPPGTSTRLLWRIPDEEDGGTWRGMAETTKLHLSYRGIDGDLYENDFVARCEDSVLWPIPEHGETPDTNIDPSRVQFYSLFQAVARRVGELTR